MADRPYPSYLIYKDRVGEYRWRYESANGRTIADSGEGYKNKADCKRGIEIMQASSTSPVWKAGDVE